MQTWVVRRYEPRDAAGVRRCVIALQEFERGMEPSLPSGGQMAEAYCRRLHARCEEAHGCVLVAERDGTVLGFAAVVAREPFTEPDDPLGTYALVTDLVVLEEYRGQGIGRELLQRVESFAKAAGARELRIELLAGNAVARRLYVEAGFAPLLEVLAKRW